MTKTYYVYTDYVSHRGVNNLQVCRITFEGCIIKTFTSKVDKAVDAARKWAKQNIKFSNVDFTNCN